MKPIVLFPAGLRTYRQSPKFWSLFLPMKTKTKSATRGAPGPACPTQNEPCRQKYWRELNLEEKVERMRDILKMVGNTADTASASLRKTQDQFTLHSHAKNGKVLVPVQGSRTLGCDEDRRRPDPKSEDVYF